jgi:hypothetical protein
MRICEELNHDLPPRLPSGGMAASALVGASGFGNWARLAAQQALTQDQLLANSTPSAT